MKIRKAVLEDMDTLLKIYERAREYMRQSGNPNQWKTTNPPAETLIKDIEKGDLYVVYRESDNGTETLLGSFAFIGGEDPTYTYIENGSWLNNEPYYTIHRIASAGIEKGVLDFVIKEMSQLTRNIRIDTHEDNKTMQHLVTKNGFIYCGIIYLLNGESRLAYHLSL